MTRSRLLQEEREQAPGFLRWLGFALACWGVILTGSILVGFLVTFHETRLTIHRSRYRRPPGRARCGGGPIPQ
jgi:hypothetical protein